MPPLLRTFSKYWFHILLIFYSLTVKKWTKWCFVTNATFVFTKPATASPPYPQANGIVGLVPWTSPPNVNCALIKVARWKPLKVGNFGHTSAAPSGFLKSQLGVLKKWSLLPRFPAYPAAAGICSVSYAKIVLDLVYSVQLRLAKLLITWLAHSNVDLKWEPLLRMKTRMMVSNSE